MSTEVKCEKWLNLVTGIVKCDWWQSEKDIRRKTHIHKNYIQMNSLLAIDKLLFRIKIVMLWCSKLPWMISSFLLVIIINLGIFKIRNLRANTQNIILDSDKFWHFLITWHSKNYCYFRFKRFGCCALTKSHHTKTNLLTLTNTLET